ncbi:acyl carrier protein [Thermocatellispora tengchongensis]|uniref:acyl carrier protein n=1 Tax=Thermocatellispora tengchongensis TaxID=1073253 RepID=UPI00363982A3
MRPGPAEAVDLVLGDGLADTAKRLKVTRFELLLTTLHVLLRAYGNERPVVAVDLSTRTRASRDLIGPFVNELPVATEPRGTFAEFARWVRGELRAMYAYREVPIARALGGISPRSALAPVSFSYRQRTAPGPVFAGLETRVEWMMANGAVRNTLHLQVVDGPGGPAARLLFNPELLSRDDCARIGEDLCGLLLAAGEHPGAALEDLPLPTRVAAAAQAPRADTGLPAYAEGADAGLIGEVCAIWREVMALDAVEPGDDLFDLGGHSLTITEIIGRVRDRMGVEVPFEVFIDDPTPTGVAAEIAALLGGDAEEDRC